MIVPKYLVPNANDSVVPAGSAADEPTLSSAGGVALHYAAAGVPVFPCRAGDDGIKKAKSPYVDRGFHAATDDVNVVRERWTMSPTASIAMPTGPVTGIFVLDVDVKAGVDGRTTLAKLEAQHGPLPPTLRGTTPSGGKHFYFWMPEGLDLRCSAGKLGPALDLRANGGYIILPPSVLRDAAGNVLAAYRFEGDGGDLLTDRLSEIAAPPLWLIQLIMNSAAGTETRAERPNRQPAVAGKLEHLCNDVALAREGARNTTLNKAAFKAARLAASHQLSGADVETGLVNAARVAGLPPSEALATVRSGITAGLAKAASGPLFEEYKGNRPDPGSIANVRALLAWLGVALSWNSFAHRIPLRGLPGQCVLDDDSHSVLWGHAQDIDFRVSMKFLRDCLRVEALKHEQHPVRAYFDSVSPDGVPRLDGLLPIYFGTEDTELMRAFGSKIMIAAVRRVLRPGTKFDQLLVLEGAQGTGKSTALRLLAVRDEWFTDAVSLTHDCKHVLEQTAGKLIVEIAELKGRKKSDNESIKAMLSRTHDRARESYGYFASEVGRQFVLVGTTNCDKGGGCAYLTDPTGNRRFWPARTGRIDLEALRRDRDLLWAEAVQREAAGESIELPAHLWQAAEVEQQNRMEIDPWVQELANVLGDIQGKILTSDVRSIVARQLHSWTTADDRRLGRAMRELGWTNTELRHPAGRGRAYFYVRGPKPQRLISVRFAADGRGIVRYDGGNKA